MRRLGLRVRLALVFAAGFAVLLSLGSIGLYLAIERSYRQDFDQGLRDAGLAARSLFEHDRPEYGTTLAAAVHVVSELVYGDRTLVALDSTGARLAVSQRVAGQAWFGDVPGGLPAMTPTTLALDEGEARVLLAPLGDGIAVGIAISTGSLEQRLDALRHTLMLGLPLVLLVGAGVGVVGSRTVLGSIPAVAATAERIGDAVARGATSFERLPVHLVDDEIGRLTAAFNQLVDRLGSALARERGAAERQRQFLADAAHELRTPVAILRSEVEVTLSGQADLSTYRAALERVAAETDSLGGLVGDLLLIARGDEQVIRPDLRRVYLDDVVNAALARVRALPEAAGRKIRFGEFEAAPALGDPAMLERLILVLLRNALLHAPGAWIEVSTGVDVGAGARVAWARVRDGGPGIPVGVRGRIFDRFVRGSTEVPGSGLGLAIARSIAEAHGGTLELDVAPGGGSFTLRLPAEPSAARVPGAA